MVVFVCFKVYVFRFSLLSFLTRKNNKCERALAHTLMHFLVHIECIIPFENFNI